MSIMMCIMDHSRKYFLNKALSGSFWDITCSNVFLRDLVVSTFCNTNSMGESRAIEEQAYKLESFALETQCVYSTGMCLHC